MTAEDADGDHVDFGFVRGPDSIFTLQGHTGKFWILPGRIDSVAYDENSDNTYEYTFGAQDGKGGRADQTIYVHILPASPSSAPVTSLPTGNPTVTNSPPVFTSNAEYQIRQGENIQDLGQFGNYLYYVLGFF